MMEQLIYWVQEDPSGLGRPLLAGDAPTNQMAIPMMLLCLVHQLTKGQGPDEGDNYRKLGTWCVQQILQHVQVWTQSGGVVQNWDGHEQIGDYPLHMSAFRGMGRQSWRTFHQREQNCQAARVASKIQVSSLLTVGQGWPLFSPVNPPVRSGVEEYWGGHDQRYTAVSTQLGRLLKLF